MDSGRADPVIARSQGVAWRGLRQGAALAFLGIRYGLPPTGQHRFAAPRPAPLPADPDTVIAARQAGPDAWQSRRPNPFVADGPPRAMDEDCLHLNIWTPALAEPQTPGRPVLVHLFGGGFQGGSASDGAHDAAGLCQRSDTVVVRLGFRVGAAGFLWLGDCCGSGADVVANPGLLDAQLALRWVQQHISAFGGDPARVTLFGLSSGAFMAAALLAMPAARACVAQAWMQSGSASRILSRDQATAVACDLFGQLGLAPGDLAGLRAVEPARLVAAQEAVLDADLGDRNAPGGRTLGVVLDGQTLAEHPLQAIRCGQVAGHRLVLLSTRDEARLWFRLGLMRRLDDEAGFAAEVARFVGPGEPAAQLLAVYRLAGEGDLQAMRERFLTDAVYAVPALRTALAQTAAGGAAWLAQLDWSPPGEFAAFGASHGMCEPFVWGQSDPAVYRLLQGDRQAPALAAEMSDALRRFAHSGDPGWPDVAAAAVGPGRIFAGSAAVPQDHSRRLAAWQLAP